MKFSHHQLLNGCTRLLFNLIELKRMRGRTEALHHLHQHPTYIQSLVNYFSRWGAFRLVGLGRIGLPSRGQSISQICWKHKISSHLGVDVSSFFALWNFPMFFHRPGFSHHSHLQQRNRMRILTSQRPEWVGGDGGRYSIINISKSIILSSSYHTHIERRKKIFFHFHFHFL